jgi:hypothetical protein
MKVTLLLADSAQAVNGKLYVLGGGWSICGPDPTPMAIAIKIEVPWDRTNIKYPILVELVDADGQPVSLPGEGGVEAPLRIEGEIEVGRPVGVKAGTPLDAVIAINIGPVPLPPDSRFAWQFSIGGDTDEDWRVGFTTRPRFAPAGPQPSQT